MPAAKPQHLKSLSPLLTFIRPYKLMVILALAALLLTASVSLALGQGVRLLVDNGFIAGSQAQLNEASLFIVLLITLLAFGTFSRFYLMSWLGERVCADLRKAVFNQLVQLHPSYFEENQSGEIMSRLTTDTTLLQSIIGSSFSMALRSALMLIGGLFMLFFTNFKLALLVIASVPLVLVPVLIVGRRVRQLAANSQSAIADVGSYAGEVIRNIKVVQSYTQEHAERFAFSQEVENAFNVAKQRIKQRSTLIACVIFLAFGAISIMLWVGGRDVLSGDLSGGELAAFVFYAVMVAMAVATLSEVYGELQRALGSAERLLELLSVQNEIPVTERPLPLNPATEIAIELKDVSFYYPSKPQQAALSAINLTIPRGKIVALVGPSGAGKTTLFELLLRFYDPQQGEIRLHNQPLTQLDPTAARHTMAVVPQQPVLFSADVWHNIGYGKSNAEHTEIIEAAKRAHCHQFLTELPDGYSSFLGEQGVRLSGGQKQRIAIARAILKDPEILLLDEATSALDSESEHQVQSALNELMINRTTLIIAHRLATVRHADTIVLMDKGQIIATGNHEELYQNSSLYRRLCELQFADSQAQQA